MLTRAQRDQIRAMIRPLRNRIDNMVARGVVTLVNNAVKMQKIQVGIQEGETADDVEHFQPFGFKSVPLAGAESVLLFVGGDRNAPVAVVTDDRRHRPTGWDDGEAGTFNAFSAQMHHKADGTTEITGGGAAIPLATKADLDKLLTVLNNWIPVATDGGLALQTALLLAYPGSVTATGTQKLKGE